MGKVCMCRIENISIEKPRHLRTYLGVHEPRAREAGEAGQVDVALLAGVVPGDVAWCVCLVICICICI